MDSIRPPSPELDEALNTMRELREDVVRHEQLLEKIMAQLQQLSEQAPFRWIPPTVREGLTEPIQSSRRIRKVQPLPTKSHDIVGRFRASWPGQLYTSHLKQYAVIRWIAHSIWRNGYPFYVNHVAPRLSGTNNKARRWRPLIKLSDFSKKNGIPTYKLVDAAFVETPEPKVFPDSDQGCLASPHDRFRFPEIYVAILNDVITYGGTNLILSGDEVVCHDLYDFARDYTSEELHGRALIDPKHSRIRWLLHDEAPEPIPAAAAFVDACASNYAHWMTEVLPRIVLFCAEDKFFGVPIVVNAGLHKNIMESLFFVAGTAREIITLPIGRALAVNTLYLTSVTGYVPFGRRPNKLSGHSHGLFSPRSFELLRNYFDGFGVKIEQGAWPEKIYLRRNLGARQVTNASEIEKLLLVKGYVTVEPEKLTFLQQIQLFNHAKEIVSPTGAALANAIACKPGAQVAILMAKHNDMIYGYWSNLLSPFGIKVSYVLGTIVGNHDRGIHGDFVIDTDCINELLEGFEHK